MAESPQKAPGGNPSPSPKSSPTKKEIDAATAALNHFAQGKRHLIVGDIPSAVNALQEACRFLAEEYGETAPECGDAYFHYGRALLEMARMENGVLGNALDGVPEGEDTDNSQVESPGKIAGKDHERITKEVWKALEGNYKELEEGMKVKMGKDTYSIEKEPGKGVECEKELINKKVLVMENGVNENSDIHSVEESEQKKETANGVKMDNDGNEMPESELAATTESGNFSTNNSEMEVDEEEKGDACGDRKVKEDVSMEGDQPDENNKMEGEEDEKKTEEGSTEDDEEEEEEEEDEDDGDGDGDGESQGGESQDGESQDEDGKKEENESQEEAEGEKTEEEEEVSNLQLSWEMLELSKVIFEKQQDSNPAMAEKVAQVYLKLGEVGLESENYAQGIEDLRKCLEIQEKVLKEDNRCIAETHYQLGVAHSFSDDFDKAVESLQAAVRVIELRMNNLQKAKKEKELWTEEQKVKDAAERVDPFYTEQGEIDELSQLLPEIKEKILDMEEMKKDTKEKLQKAAKEAFSSQTLVSRAAGPEAVGSSQSGFDAPSSASSTSEAKPIMHLVRKKRKPEDEAAGEVKKVKGEKGEALSIANGTDKRASGQPEIMKTEENKESPSKSQSAEEFRKKAIEEKNKKPDAIKEQSQVVT